jgi:hypothetical protein
MLQTTWHNTITTPIPTDVKPADIIKGLHNHDLMISVSPFVVRHNLASTSPSGKQTYDIVDKIDILPFGLWKREVSFTATFEDNANGTTSSVKAPSGLVITGDYAVKPAAGHVSAEDGAMVLVEEVQTSASVLLKHFVQSTLVSSHEKNHQKLIDWAREQGSGSGGVN